jgi:hypothetical protein
MRASARQPASAIVLLPDVPVKLDSLTVNALVGRQSFAVPTSVTVAHFCGSQWLLSKLGTVHVPKCSREPQVTPVSDLWYHQEMAHSQFSHQIQLL